MSDSVMPRVRGGDIDEIGSAVALAMVGGTVVAMSRLWWVIYEGRQPVTLTDVPARL